MERFNLRVVCGSIHKDVTISGVINFEQIDGHLYVKDFNGDFAIFAPGVWQLALKTLGEKIENI